ARLQPRNLLAAGIPRPDDEADDQRLAALLADVPVQLPAQRLELSPCGRRVEPGNGGVVPVLLRALQEEMVAEWLRMRVDPSESRGGDRLRVDALLHGDAQARVVQDRSGRTVEGK